MAKNVEGFIQWYEGMLLSPQHFQQSDNYIQKLCAVFSSSLTPFYYGVHNLKIDTSALASGVIRVLNVRGILKDGLFFDYDAISDRPLERNLTEYFTISSDPIKIYLALPKKRLGENLLMGDFARYYSSELVSISDENTGQEEMNIPILKPRLRLLLKEELDERYTSFPLFEAQKSMDGGVVGTDFLPPYIYIDEHSKVAEFAREIVELIRHKIAYFSDRKDNYSRIASDESMSCLRLLIEAALPLEALIRVNGISTFEIYKTFLEALSKLISLNPNQFIPKLPIYNHDDLHQTFNGLIVYAKGILDKMKQKYDLITFEKEGEVFKLRLKKEWLAKDEIAIGIQKSFSNSYDELLNWVNTAQIASESMLPLIKDKRVLGVERRIMERGEYITQPSGVIILAVNIKNSYIKPTEKLCVVNHSQKFSPEEVVLYAE